jgi:hypothetical protein
MIEDAELMDRLKLVVGLGVGARQAMGRDPDTIRREVLAVATKAMRDNLDEHELEAGVAVARREIDRLLTPGERPRVKTVVIDGGPAA